MFTTVSRRSIVLLAGLGAALTLAACDSAASVTQPTQKSFQANARHDDGDTTCKSGYIEANGRMVCA